MFAETSGSGHGKVGGVTPNQEPGSSEEPHGAQQLHLHLPGSSVCGIGRYIYSYLHPSRETSGAGCPRAPPTSRGRPWWPARARGIQVTDPTQPQDIHYPHPCPSSGQSYSAPQSWSSSAGGAPHTSPGFSKFSPAEWANSNVYHYNTADQVSGRLLPNVVNINVHRCHTIGDLSSRPCPRSLGSSRSGSGARRCG